MSSPPNQKVFVAVIGVGLIGTEFITQLLKLPSDLKSFFSLISLTSSKHTLFSLVDPITNVTSWKDRLTASTANPDLAKLTSDLTSLVTSTQKVALVDNTSSEDVAAMYPTWLKAGINVITPNKKAFSGQLELYRQIEYASLETGARYFNEATVGAGLPVIRTLEDLVNTGDEVRDASCSGNATLTRR
jgi:homoserine dehydrogenase